MFIYISSSLCIRFWIFYNINSYINGIFNNYEVTNKVYIHQLKSVSIQYSIKILHQFIGFWTLLYANFLCYFQIVVLSFQLAKRETLKVEFLDGLVIGSELPYAFDKDGRVPCSPHVHIWVEAWTSCFYFEV